MRCHRNLTKKQKPNNFNKTARIAKFLIGSQLYHQRVCRGTEGYRVDGGERICWKCKYRELIPLKIEK